MTNEFLPTREIAFDIIEAARIGERLMIDFGEFNIDELREMKSEISRQIRRINARIIDLRASFSEQKNLARERELLETSLRQICARIYKIEIEINERRFQ